MARVSSTPIRHNLLKEIAMATKPKKTAPRTKKAAAKATRSPVRPKKAAAKSAKTPARPKNRPALATTTAAKPAKAVPPTSAHDATVSQVTTKKLTVKAYRGDNKTL